MPSHSLSSRRFPDLKRSFCSLTTIVVALSMAVANVPHSYAEFPSRPITIIVYTGPGGPIDYTARQFVEVARKYTDATFVVENKPGAGGIIALQQVLQSRADGYTLFACTKSTIAKLISAGYEADIQHVDWLSLLLRDRECVITRRDSPWASFEGIVVDARSRPGQQTWLGPASGGLDHITALRIWERYGVTAKWIPFKGGSEALTALMGGNATAYVGNPGDAANQPELRVQVISSPQRLPQWPDTPTFGELGYPELDQQYMWRGLALREHCPPDAKAWYAKLITQVTEDPHWRNLWTQDGMEVVDVHGEEFRGIVEQDRAEFSRYLSQLDLLPKPANSVQGKTPLVVLLALLATAVAVGWRLKYLGRWHTAAPIVIVGFLGALCMLLLWMTFDFPPPTLGLGAASVPRCWIGVFAVCSTSVIVNAYRSPGVASVPRTASHSVVGPMLMILTSYVLLMPWAGYYVTSFVFLVVTMWLLGQRRPLPVLTIAAAWLAVSYFVFQRLLFVPLPLGRWFEAV